VHIDRDEQTCKYWLEPSVLARNLGYTAKELRDIEKIIIENKQDLLEAWYPHLLHATREQCDNWRICGGGYGITWPDIDEDLSTEGLLRGASTPKSNISKVA